MWTVVSPGGDDVPRILSDQTHSEKIWLPLISSLETLIMKVKSLSSSKRLMNAET